MRSKSKSQVKILLGFLTFRMINAFIVRSYAHPDEYWQGQEVSHVQAFGYGYLTWEWKVSEPIRNAIHPLIYAFMYKFLNLLGLDTPLVVAYSPKLIQGILAGLADYGTYVLAQYYLAEKAWMVVIVVATNWFSLFSLPRGYIQNFELVLNLWALIFWHKSATSVKAEIFSRVLIAVAFTMRFTAIIFWVAVWLCDFFQKTTTIKRGILACFKQALQLGFSIGLSFAVDSWYHGRLVSSHWNFIKFNVFNRGSAAYGVQGVLYYATTSIPLILLSWLLFFIWGVVYGLRDTKNWVKPAYLIMLIVFPLGFLSQIAHKEDRFMIPLLPYLSILTAIGLDKFLQAMKRRQILASVIVLLVILSNLLFFSYSAFVDKVGALNSFDYLRAYEAEIKQLAVLTECHRTPYYSFIHRNIDMYLLDCSPRLDGTISDSKKFAINPGTYFHEAVFTKNVSHILTYNHYVDNDYIFDLLKSANFVEEVRFFNSFYVDTDVGYQFDHHLVLLKRSDQIRVGKYGK